MVITNNQNTQNTHKYEKSNTNCYGISQCWSD